MTSSTSAVERLHGLDAVRGYALLLGVVFHATMSFISGHPIWVVTDAHRTPALGAVFFAAHTFRMTTFFLIAGFFARMSFEKRGARGFILERLKRIGVPLVAGWPVIIISILLTAGYGVYVATGTFPTKPPPSPPGPFGAFPLTHLWFLNVLLLLYAATLALRALVARMDRHGRLRRGIDGLVRGLVESPAGPLMLAAPAAVALYLYPGWRPWFGVPTPDSNLVPNLPAAVQFFLAFGFGWLVHRQPGLMQVWKRQWALQLSVGVLLVAGLLSHLGLEPVLLGPAPGFERGALALGYAFATWTLTFGVIGAALRFLSGESPVRRYIADSSYWIYLIHLPLVIALQAAVSRLDWAWEVKFAAVLAIGFAVMFATYELLVRHTFVGLILNGRRVPWRARPAALPETAR
ncbi:MAG: acyltransferase family protein [Phenylobacterium sp.]